MTRTRIAATLVVMMVAVPYTAWSQGRSAAALDGTQQGTPFQQLQTQLSALEAQVLAMRQQIQALQAQIGQVERWLQAALTTINGTLATLQAQIAEERDLLRRPVGLLRAMTGYAPAFGMLGTLFGLMQMLFSLGSGDLGTLGGAMGFAMLTTVYGLILCNLVLKPARDYTYMCSDPGQDLIKADIIGSGLNRVVVASCSPLMHEPTFRRACEEAGLNPFFFQMANIREHCSWVIDDRELATAKAKSMVGAAVRRVHFHMPLELRNVEMHSSALVVGGGIAGIEAALRLADAGKQVHLVEREPSIGGHMSQLYKTFPTLDCAA